MPLPVVDPARYADQLAEKVETVCALLAPFAPPAPQIHASPASHYRHRAEFRLWRDGDALDYVMFDPEPVKMQQFPVASRRINHLMRELMTVLRSSEVLSRKLYQVDFHDTFFNGTGTQSADASLISLIYHRPLDAAWEAAARELEAALQCAVVGRSRRQRVVLSRAYVTDHFAVGEHVWSYRQPEGAFSQPNGAINQQMLNWVYQRCAGLPGDALELYCGNGNFTLPLAAQFRQVLATEISKAAVPAARHNLDTNGVDNVCLLRMSSEEFSEALSGVRTFQRLQDIDLDSYRFSTLLVDPPRAGLDPGTLALARRFDTLLYISCNPDTLCANLAELGSRWRIEDFAVFDQFPYTPHLECAVRVSRSST
ncbi:MAG: tRNA (uridine(54)-C5)-methyltransferase TrmA [Spongiibacteraceae bacterium]|jgi:tRNA (uracil-5-)-methyltransferase|nr:tRNA (uridine(54)-C5)-methyltransferase TrmA [Spongiibacteraceae bacterium]